MLELYWLKAVIAIFEVVAFEAAFVADAERRRRELDIRNAKGPKKRWDRRVYCVSLGPVARFRAPTFCFVMFSWHVLHAPQVFGFELARRSQVVGCAPVHRENPTYFRPRLLSYRAKNSKSRGGRGGGYVIALLVVLFLAASNVSHVGSTVQHGLAL